MKFLFVILLFLSTTTIYSQSIIIMPNQTKQVETQTREIPWDIISATTGAVGLALTFIPYFSIIGLIFSGIAIFAGIISRRKKQKKILAKLGIIFGGLSFLALLGVMALMAFF